jgi:predicted TIM-barrel fold metal-dependent hydrolase
MSNLNVQDTLNRRRLGPRFLVFLALGSSLVLVGCKPVLELRERWRERAWLRQLAALEPIDAHTHISRSGPAFTGMLERLHMQVLDILYVDDTVKSRSSLERLRQDAQNFIDSSHGHATLCTTFDPFRLNDAGFAQNAIDGLNRDFARGAVAAKVWKNIGMEIKSPSGQYVMPDDPVFEPIYRDIAEHGKTLVIHAAAVDAAWQPQGASGNGSRYFEKNPQWDMSKNPGAPAKKEILQARDHLLVRHPNLRVVGAHLGSMEAQLDQLGARLDRFPNFAVDISARVHNLTLLPRDVVRSFFLKYQDRILYGTDLSFSADDRDDASAQTWQTQYLLDWRYFSTDEEFLYDGRKVQGLSLPSSVLKKLYRDNALHWIPGISGNST